MKQHLTVRLLVASAGTTTSEFLGFPATGVSNKQRTVVGKENVLDFLLLCLIDVYKMRAIQQIEKMNRNSAGRNKEYITRQRGELRRAANAHFW